MEKAMKKHGVFLFLLWGSLLLTSCAPQKSGQTSQTGTTEGPVQCEQSVFFSGTSEMAVGPEGYYSLNGMGTDHHYLTYIDKASARETYLCGRPDCPHVDESGHHVLETCDAYVGSVIPRSIVYHNGYVYVLKYDPESYNVTLVKISADGSAHEDIMVVGQAADQSNSYQYVFLDDNTIILTYTPPADGQEEITVSLDRVDLDKKEKTPVYTYTGTAFAFLKVMGQDVFFTQVAKLEKYYAYQLVKWNAAEDRVETVLDKSIGPYTIANENLLFYYVPKDGLYRLDLQSGEEKLVRECDENTMYAALACDGTYVYLDNFMNQSYYDEASEHNLYVCDFDGKVVNTIPTPVLYVELSDPDYLFHRVFVNGKLPLWSYIRKEDITDPNVTWSVIEE